MFAAGNCKHKIVGLTVLQGHSVKYLELSKSRGTVTCYRLDAADGCEPGVAAVRGACPAGPGGGAGDHHLPCLHTRDHQVRDEGRLRLLPSGIHHEKLIMPMQFRFRENLS
jgi:hypothetical protein